MNNFNPSKILIPVDFSSTSLLAIEHGAFTAQLGKADVYLLHVINSQFQAVNMFLPMVKIETPANFEKEVDSKLNQLASDITKKYGVKVNTIIKSGSPSHIVNETAKEIEASLIVMGTHGYSPLEELVIGSIALRVLTKSSCPTMVMSSKATHKGYSKILIPIDSSVNSRQKVNYAIDFAKCFSAQLQAVALLGSNEIELIEEMHLILKQIGDLATAHGVSYTGEVVKDVKNRANSTIEFAEKNGSDLVIIMTDQDAELSGLFLGAYAQQIIHINKVPTIAIKPKNLSGGDSSILGGTSGGGSY